MSFSEYTICVEEVVSDDRGDTQWTYRASLHDGDTELWHDYFNDNPLFDEIFDAAANAYRQREASGEERI